MVADDARMLVTTTLDLPSILVECSMGNSSRFHLNTDKYIPPWIEWGTYAAFVAIGLVILITLVFIPDWFLLFSLCTVLVALWLAFVSVRGLRNRGANYVEFGVTGFDVVHYALFQSIRVTVPYSEIAKVVDGSKRLFFLIQPWPNTTRFWVDHVEVHLRKAIRVPVWSRFPPYTRVIHLDTERPEELASE